MIGPNAITRVAEVLPDCVGSDMARTLFEHAGLLEYLREPPEAMVAEAEVRQLHHVLRHDLGWLVARGIARAAGQRTAEYLLSNRIPRPVQWLLKLLPAALAARVLVSAIRRNAWTFVGSGQFQAQAGHPVVLTIRKNPLCLALSADAPACEYYAATFEGLFRALVNKRSVVTESECEAFGGAMCRFEVSW